jgi:dethiobiotin synthetase
MQHTVFFISGIDTGCGKTYVTGLLAKHLRHSGIHVITQKLVQTGCTGISEDIQEHRRLMECDMFEEDHAGLTCPYIFAFPASPQLAATLEHTVVDIGKLSDATSKLSEKYDIVLIEGAGGLHVPLTDNLLMIDYIGRQKYPLLLVSSSKLGSINHTLLSIESCRLHHIKLHALLYNRLPGSDNTITDHTYHVVKNALLDAYPEAMMYHVEDEYKLSHCIM